MCRFLFQIAGGSCCLVLVCLAIPGRARGQDSPANPSSSPSAPGANEDPPPQDPSTNFPHSESSRFWLSGQANIITQWHPAFHSPYQGPNSLSPEAQDASSRVLTLLTGLRINGSTEFLFDVQETGGPGIGEASWLAGFTNLTL